MIAPALVGEHGGKLDVTPDVDIYSLGKLIFYMFTGGVVMPREYLDDPRYSSVLQQAGREELHLLLSQMICGHNRRFPSMNIVIKRIDQILENRRGSNSTLTDAGKAALKQLKRSIAENEATTAAQRVQQDQADAQLDVVRRAIVSTVRTCLEDSAKELHTEGAIDSYVRTANCSTKPFNLGTARAQTLEGVELTWRKTTSPHARTFALQFQFFRKAGVRGKMKVGVLVAFEIREPNGRRVANCAAYLAQKQMGKDRYQYSLTRGDPVPAFIEREVDAWGDMEELRHFVRHAISAFPNLIAGDTSQFVMLELEARSPRRR